MNNKEIEKLERRKIKARNDFYDDELPDEEYREMKAEITTKKENYNNINNKLYEKKNARV